MAAGSVTSGVGRSVPLHRPGPEQRRLTPRDDADLLVDGPRRVERAQDEHAAFAAALRARDAEVLLLTDLLGETLDTEVGATAGYEPGSGRGGPTCLSCPLDRGHPAAGGVAR